MTDAAPSPKRYDQLRSICSDERADILSWVKSGTLSALDDVERLTAEAAGLREALREARVYICKHTAPQLYETWGGGITRKIDAALAAGGAREGEAK